MLSAQDYFSIIAITHSHNACICELGFHPFLISTSDGVGACEKEGWSNSNGENEGRGCQRRKCLHICLQWSVLKRYASARSEGSMKAFSHQCEFYTSIVTALVQPMGWGMTVSVKWHYQAGPLRILVKEDDIGIVHIWHISGMVFSETSSTCLVMEDTASDLVEGDFQVLSNGEVYKSAVTYLLNILKGS